MRIHVWLFALVVPALTSACTEPCQRSSDCESGSYCELSQCKTDCTSNLDCGPTTGGVAMVCTDRGRCTMPDDQPVFDDTDGAQDPVGSGRVFIINELEIADPASGFDLDDKCGPEGCADNLLGGVLGELLNDQIRQTLFSGSNLILLEVAGLDGQSIEVTQNVTLKIYSAADSDQPYFPANNFDTPPGYETCCEFVVLQSSLNNNQARVQIPARMENGNLFAQAPFSFVFPLFIPMTASELMYEEPLLIPLEAGEVELAFFRDDTLIGVLGGAAPIRGLAATANPYCTSVSPRCPVAFPNSNLLTLITTLVSPIPDIDLDGDGPECAIDSDFSGDIDVCCDGAGIGNSSCQFPPGSCVNGATRIESSDPAIPGACARDQRLADGYSIAFAFKARPASIVGVR